jgi:hypothetical protein
MDSGDFYITLQSDSNPNFFGQNTITDFRNQFSPPIKLDGQYEVALVECTYVHSEVIVEKGEKICTHNSTLITAKHDHTSIESILRELNIQGLSLINGSIVDSFSSERVDVHESSDEDEEWRDVEDLIHDKKTNRIYKEIRPPYSSFRTYEQSTFSSIKFNHPSVAAHQNHLKILWEPKIASIIGYNSDSDTYDQAVYAKTGMTEMFVYCDIVHLQRVGGDMVPLIKKMSYTGIDQTPLTREFVHNQYKRVSKNEIDSIRMYIRTESGAPVPLRFGNFSATLHFRPL